VLFEWIERRGLGDLLHVLAQISAAEAVEGVVRDPREFANVVLPSVNTLACTIPFRSQAGRCTLGQQSLTVMVADQHPPVRAAVRTVVDQLGGRKIVHVEDGSEFMPALMRDGPQVIVVDAALPNLDVFQTVRHLRRLPYDPTRRIGIVLLAAGATPDMVRKARDAGIDEMLCKPFSADQLRTRLRAAAFARREFVIAERYVGPCRRRFVSPLYEGRDRRTPTEDPGSAIAQLAAKSETARATYEKELAAALRRG
jgi:two-component system chemotaxis response regulator CheY